MRIAIAEDNPHLAQSIQDKLAQFPREIEFLFWAENGQKLIDKLKDEPAVDVILMDIEMPRMDGIATTAHISQNFPHIKIIMLTVFDDDEKIFNSIQAGAMGYLLKDEPAAVLFNAIKEIMNGGAPMSPLIAAKSLQMLKGNSLQPKEKQADFGLSQREVDVLELISMGYAYKEIAEKLYIAPSTVRKHIEHIYSKLQVNNKMRAVKKASAHKII